MLIGRKVWPMYVGSAYKQEVMAGIISLYAGFHYRRYIKATGGKCS